MADSPFLAALECSATAYMCATLPFASLCAASRLRAALRWSCVLIIPPAAGSARAPCASLSTLVPSPRSACRNSSGMAHHSSRLTMPSPFVSSCASISVMPAIGTALPSRFRTSPSSCRSCVAESCPERSMSYSLNRSSSTA
eukprot:SAG22_NODE_3016_length_2025_cov_1.704569_2_plen_141_part_01